MIRCTCTSKKCTFKIVDKEIPYNEAWERLDEHFTAIDAVAAAKEAPKLKQKADEYQKQLQEEKYQADLQMKAAQHQAEMVKQNSELVISEQLAVNEALLKETARLKQELIPAQCVICRDAKPSMAFFPCGHVGMASCRRVAGNCPAPIAVEVLILHSFRLLRLEQELKKK